MDKTWRMLKNGAEFKLPLKDRIVFLFRGRLTAVVTLWVQAPVKVTNANLQITFWHDTDHG